METTKSIMYIVGIVAITALILFMENTKSESQQLNTVSGLEVGIEKKPMGFSP